MGRVTVKKLKRQATELLKLQPLFEEYQRLQGELKAGLVKIGYKELEVDEGRVFIAQSERVTVSPELAREVLSPLLAEKVIRTTETVPNQLLKAMVEIGDISEAERDKLLQGATRSEVVNLYIRPLK